MLETDYGFVFPELSEDEKEKIREKIKEKLENDYGLDLPDLTPEQREAVKNKRNEIIELQKELRDMLKEASRLTKIRFYRYVKNTMNNSSLIEWNFLYIIILKYIYKSQERLVK